MSTHSSHVKKLSQIRMCRKYFFRYIALILILISYDLYSQNNMLNVLILSGQNNHNWRETTPEIQNILEASGRFNVVVTNDPSNLIPDELKIYDVILSNWNTWPEVTGKRWDSALEIAFLDFVREGKGLVIIHAGSSTLQDWNEFQQIAGGTWEKGVTGHGPIHTFKVNIDDARHPITRGLNDFYIKDELWHKTKIQSNSNTLCNAFSSPQKKGSGKNEPVAITTRYGMGRCFFSILGHNKSTMMNNAWRTLLLRGTEWAASGKVTIPIQKPWPMSEEMANKQSEFYWRESESSLTLLKNDAIVWRFNFPKTGKPYFHPLNIEGKTLTCLSPEDHPWHYGLWFSWKYINGINYWEEDRISGRSEGTTMVENCSYELNDDFSALLNLQLLYEYNDKAVLSERRNLYVSPLNASNEYYIDWTSTFIASGDSVKFERTPIEGEDGGRRWGGYATLGLRFNSIPFSKISLLNDQGETGLDIHTSPTRWTDITGTVRADSSINLGITIFDHKENPRAPVPGYVIDRPLDKDFERFVYTNPAFLYNGSYTLAPRKDLELKYRIYIHTDKGEPNYLNQIFSNYINNKNMEK